MKGHFLAVIIQLRVMDSSSECDSDFERAETEAKKMKRLHQDVACLNETVRELEDEVDDLTNHRDNYDISITKAVNRALWNYQKEERNDRALAATERQAEEVRIQRMRDQLSEQMDENKRLKRKLDDLYETVAEFVSSLPSEKRPRLYSY